MENQSKNNMLIVAVVVVLLIGGIFVFIRSNKKTMTPTVLPTTIMEQTPSPEPTLEATEEASDAMEKPKKMDVVLAAIDKDLNQSGKATLTEEDEKVKVVLSLTVGDLKDAQPAHIHKGDCPGVGEVAYPLTNVVSGKSETILNTTLADLKKELPLAINVHKSAGELKVYTACGGLK